MIPDLPAVSRRFDYTVPDRWAGEVRVGSRVRVVLHGRRVGAWIAEDDVRPPPGVEARPLAGVSGYGPPPPVIALAEWASWRWAGPLPLLLRTASPERVVRQLPESPDWPSLAGREPMPADGRSVPEAHHRSPAELDGAVAAAFGDTSRPTVVRLPPAATLAPLVLSMVAEVARRAEGRRAEAVGSVVVLTPTLEWAGRVATYLESRGAPVAAGWAEEAAGWPVVVGSRATALTPAPRLAAVIVLDAHAETYREERAPTVNAAAMIAERARREGAPCLLVSPCPPATLAPEAGRWAPERSVERAGWPVVEIVDRRAADPRTGLLSEEIVRLARPLLAGPGPWPALVCVLNRTGRAKLLACAACRELSRCERCGHPVEQTGATLHCRACRTDRPVVCAACGSTRLRVLRPGVARIREDLEALLGVAVAEVAGPRAATASPAALPAPVLVGTEAVLHRSRRAGAVAFLDFDQHLAAPRHGAAEESLALLAAAGRLVGGRGTAGTGRVLVQTRVPDHPVLVAAQRGDPAAALEAELALRRELHLPPASALALLSGPAAGELAAAIVELGTVIGAGPGAEVVVADLGDGRWLVRAVGHSELSDVLAAAPRPKGRVRVEVDPIGV